MVVLRFFIECVVVRVLFSYGEIKYDRAYKIRNNFINFVSFIFFIFNER